MSVFTPVSQSELTRLLDEAGLRLLAFRPASSGIENSNYLIDATHADGQRRDVVLTLFEQLPAAALPWYADLMEYLSAQDLPVPCPLLHPRGRIFNVAGKPAVLVPRLPGDHILSPMAHHCRQIGTALARLHLAQIDKPAPRPDERSQLLERLALLPDGAEKELARAQITAWLKVEGPRVLVHADLFRDNALFLNDTLSGLLDFYNACHDHPAYDLAVTINDWCVDDQGVPLPTHQQALLDGYCSKRTLSPEELSVLPQALVIAALRFWLSRLAGACQQAIEGPGSKDPEPMRRLYHRRLMQVIEVTPA